MLRNLDVGKDISGHPGLDPGNERRRSGHVERFPMTEQDSFQFQLEIGQRRPGQRRGDAFRGAGEYRKRRDVMFESRSDRRREIGTRHLIGHRHIEETMTILGREVAEIPAFPLENVSNEVRGEILAKDGV